MHRSAEAASAVATGAGVPRTDLAAPVLNPALGGVAALDEKPSRLLSLDVFRGLVVFAMLVVNNPGDYRQVGYFLKHADWDHPSFSADWAAYFRGETGLISGFPLFLHCTLADYVMPMFMLIIGIAIPYSVASAARRGKLGLSHWLHVLRRGGTLYVLGWTIGISLTLLNYWESPAPDRKLMFWLGMDVLQLLGVSYVVARVVYSLPAAPRLAAVGGLFLWHWAFLRFYPQGDVPAGTFTEHNNAVAYAYRHWPVFVGFRLTGHVGIDFKGMLSVPPAAATMLLGTWVGETVRNKALPDSSRLRRLAFAGLVLSLLGIAWAFDLPMNKPRWSPAYLVYCSGVGVLLLAVIYYLFDRRPAGPGQTSLQQGGRGPLLSACLATPFVVLGLNAIGIYYLSVFGKIWTLNVPKVDDQRLEASLVSALASFTTPVVGSWLFTALFVGTLWALAAVAYRKNFVLKV